MPEPDADGPNTTPLERVVRELIDDPALRPVLIVAVLILGTFLAGGILLALRGANLFAMAGIAGAVLMTAIAVDDEIRTTRRMTLGVWALASIWLAAALVALTLVRIGAF